MFNITICDDEEFTCSEVENMILEYAQSRSIKVEIEIFYSGESLCKYLEKKDNMDILFLDIELDKLTGVDVGKILRNDMKNETTQIIYISSKESYAMKLFKIRPLDFLIKPLQIKEVEEVLDKAISLIELGNHFFEYHIGKTYYKVPIRDICYFKSDGKKIQIVTQNPDNIKEFYDKMDEIEEQVSEERFLRIHKSYLVHYSYILEYKYDCVKMTNGEILAISQSSRKDVRMKLMERREEKKIVDYIL